MNGYSVSEINHFVKQIFLAEEIFYNIAVRGEISNFNHHRSGHMYFTLKDQSSSIKCVMFSSDAQRVTFFPQNGMQVVVRGNIGVFERDGVYQIYVTTMQQQGEGESSRQLQQVAQKLLAEGLFDASNKKPIPKYPNTIGVITAENAAALKDILQVLTRRYPLADVQLYSAQVQGEGAKESICAALFKAAKRPPDVLIIGRGGGSAEDLSAFDDESVVRAVAEFPAPVISAVGHEVNTCLTDLAADLRAPTPSAAAELAVPDCKELKKFIDNFEKILYNKALERMYWHMQRMQMLRQRLQDASPSNRLSVAEQQLGGIRCRLLALGRFAVDRSKKQLEFKQRMLKSLSPYQILSRGYAVVSDERSNILRFVSDVEQGMVIAVRLADGEFKAVADLENQSMDAGSGKADET